MKVSKPVGTSPETKLQSVIENQNTIFQSNLKTFMEYDVVFKFGNPSNFDKRLFYTFSTRYIENPISYSSYEQGNLPPQITLAQSKTQNQKTWEALEFYVGNSTIPQLEYKNSGSYITDFFIDLNVQFNEKNVIDFTPLIKIYATQKLNGFAKPPTAQPINVPPSNSILAPNGPQPPQLPSAPNNQGDAIELATLQSGSTVTIYKFGPNIYAVLRDQNGTILKQGPNASASITTNEQLRESIIKAQYVSLSNNSNDPQFVKTIVNVSPSSQNVQVTTTTTQQQQAPPGLPTNTSFANSGTNVAKFYGLMDGYIEQNNYYIGNVLNVMLPAVRKQLPNVFHW